MNNKGKTTGEIKYPCKSKKYKGVYQRKNGTWFYRVKRVVNGKDIYYQQSGYDTELEAHRASIQDLWEEEYQNNYNEIITITTFKHAFKEFMFKKVNSKPTREKFQGIYNKHLYIWENKIIGEIRDSEIDLILLKMALKIRYIEKRVGKETVIEKKRYTKSHIDAVRKLIIRIFTFAMERGYIHENIITRFTKQPYRLRVMSLFSGIGAPEQALKELGIDYELVNYCEIDKFASKAYSVLHNVPESANLRDVKKMDTSFWRNYPNFDILIFGFPCQDISNAGLKTGLLDKHGNKTRSGLFFDAMEIASKELPKFIIVENVAAIAKKACAKDFALITKTMEDAGYQIYSKTLNSKDFGVPQNRDRYFWVLIRKDLNLKYEFPEPLPKKEVKEDWLSEWLDTDVPMKYYVKTPLSPTLSKRFENYDFMHLKGYINCILTKGGTPSHDKQNFVKDEKGIRCLTPNELMRFQGFPDWYGDKLLDNGFSNSQIYHMVGNSITVPVIKAIIEQFIAAL